VPVAVAVGVIVGVMVGVAVGVGVSVGVGGAVTDVTACASLFVSSNSATWKSGSTMAVFTMAPTVGTKPTMVTVTVPPGSRLPRLQSSVPPVREAITVQLPAVVPKLVYVKFEGGVSMSRTGLAVWPPTFRTSMV
jgi:hypothetical protein